MAKWVKGAGGVVGLRYLRPISIPEVIIVDLDTGGRISALMELEVAKRNLIVVGDRIRLEYQPGEEAGIGGCLGRKRGLCRNVEVLPPA